MHFLSCQYESSSLKEQANDNKDEVVLVFTAKLAALEKDLKEAQALGNAALLDQMQALGNAALFDQLKEMKAQMDQVTNKPPESQVLGYAALSDQLNKMQAQLDQVIKKPPARQVIGSTKRPALPAPSLNARTASATAASSGAAARGKADARNSRPTTQALSKKVTILLPFLLKAPLMHALNNIFTSFAF